MHTPRHQSLDAWLIWLNTLHPKSIDLGLERCRIVAERLGIGAKDVPKRCRIITVGGTNGKGSCVTMLESILRAGGYRTGKYTSPHFFRYNERIAINNQAVSDEALCNAFAEIDAARGDVSLTEFEFGTLAAVWLMLRAEVDVMILEVGLGGRLDAVNIWDADISLITSIALEHCAWLGDTREKIAVEKTGIMRQGKICIYAEAYPPDNLKQLAAEKGANVYCYGEHYTYSQHTFEWQWQYKSLKNTKTLATQQAHYPNPALLGDFQIQNAAAVITLLQLATDFLPLTQTAFTAGLQTCKLAGRLQAISHCPEFFVDVAHNPHAAKQLAAELEKKPAKGKTFAIFSILADKDIDGVIKPLLSLIDEWHISAIKSERALALSQISARLSVIQPAAQIQQYPQLQDALYAVQAKAAPEDRIIAFGSFGVAAEMMAIDVQISL